MGTLFFCDYDRKQLIKHLVDKNPKVQRHCLRGNVLWALCKEDDGRQWIACVLLKNGGRDGWGYKDMDESCGPFYYSCPLAYLKAAPVTNAEWRAHVAEYHDRAAQRRHGWSV